MSVGRENVIDLEQDEHGVFVPSKVRVRKQKQEKPRVQRQRIPVRQQREIERIADQVQSPQLQQFIYGANLAFDIMERFKKAFK